MVIFCLSFTWQPGDVNHQFVPRRTPRPFTVCYFIQLRRYNKPKQFSFLDLDKQSTGLCCKTTANFYKCPFLYFNFSTFNYSVFNKYKREFSNPRYPTSLNIRFYLLSFLKKQHLNLYLEMEQKGISGNVKKRRDWLK